VTLPRLGGREVRRRLVRGRAGAAGLPSPGHRVVRRLRADQGGRSGEEGYLVLYPTESDLRIGVRYRRSLCVGKRRRGGVVVAAAPGSTAHDPSEPSDPFGDPRRRLPRPSVFFRVRGNARRWGGLRSSGSDAGPLGESSERSIRRARPDATRTKKHVPGRETFSRDVLATRGGEELARH